MSSRMTHTRSDLNDLNQNEVRLMNKLSCILSFIFSLHFSVLLTRPQEWQEGSEGSLVEVLRLIVLLT